MYFNAADGSEGRTDCRFLLGEFLIIIQLYMQKMVSQNSLFFFAFSLFIKKNLVVFFNRSFVSVPDNITGR